MTLLDFDLSAFFIGGFFWSLMLMSKMFDSLQLPDVA